MDVNKAIEPDQLIWDNLSSSRGSTSRWVGNLVLAVLFVIALLALTSLIEGFRQKAHRENPPLQCPSAAISHLDAY